MPSKNSVLIRKFKSSDREEIRKISCDTAFLGNPRETIFNDDEILADVLTLYYTDCEPDSCFVAVKENRVIGYLTGAKNIAVMHKIFNMKIIPKLILKSLRRGVFFRKNNQRFLIHSIMSFIKGEFFSPPFSKQYPATLHINIGRNFRGLNIGTKLIEHYLNFLKERKVKGVHFGTISEKARRFFSKLGFSLLFEAKRSYLKYYLGKEIKYYVFGKTF